MLSYFYGFILVWVVCFLINRKFHYFNIGLTLVLSLCSWVGLFVVITFSLISMFDDYHTGYVENILTKLNKKFLGE